MTRIAVAIPCFNEAAAIAVVLADWRRALPEAELWVFDNNSTDGTGDLARQAGAQLVRVPEQGKGHAVRAIFATLAACDAVILVDGDGTYPAAAARELLAPVLAGKADVAVGARQPDSQAGAGAMSPLRRLGNRLIRALFLILIGRRPGDLLSGYRVFSRHFLATIAPRSRGFEIEAELACQAVARAMRVVEVPVSYHPRIAGTQSKLRAFRDGLRIVATIAWQGLRLRSGSSRSAR
jgi:glycosyltransferase involved in cell wall biosynthesis